MCVLLMFVAQQMLYAKNVSKNEIEAIRKKVFEDKDLVKTFEDLKAVKIIPKLLESNELKKISSGIFYDVEIEERSSKGTYFTDKLCVKMGKSYIVIECKSTNKNMPQFLSTIKSSFKIKTEKDAKTFEKALDTVYPTYDNKVKGFKKVNGKWIFVRELFFKKNSGFIVDVDKRGKIVNIAFNYKLEAENISEKKTASSDLKKTSAPENVTKKEILNWLKNLHKLRYEKLTLTELDTITRLDVQYLQIDDLSYIKHLTTLKSLVLRNTNITDEALKDLKDLPSLRVLSLFKTEITDAGVDELLPLTSLTSLVVADTNITSVGLKKLSTMTSLTSLNVSGLQITDQDFKELLPLNKSLKSLVIWGTDITDASLKNLISFTSLTMLNLRRSKLTPKTINKLKKALPKCSVITE